MKESAIEAFKSLRKAAMGFGDGDVSSIFFALKGTVYDQFIQVADEEADRSSGILLADTPGIPRKRKRKANIDDEFGTAAQVAPPSAAPSPMRDLSICFLFAEPRQLFSLHHAPPALPPLTG